MNTSYKIKITFNEDDLEYLVFVDGINELYGCGETETSALLDFLEKYESNYSGFKCFNQSWVQKQISTLTILETNGE